MYLTERYRLRPTSAQHARLRVALDHSRDLYNAALEERIGAWRRKKTSITQYDQYKSLTALRTDPEWSVLPATLQRWPLQQVDLAFKAFFRRVKARADRAGFPRFRSAARFDTFGFAGRTGWRFREGRLIIKGVGALRLLAHRPLSGEVRSLTITREGRYWYALVGVEVEPAEPREGEAIGLDVGLTALIVRSDGLRVPNPRPGRALSKAVRRAQRLLARARKGSRSRAKKREAVARLKRREANIRRTGLHQTSATIVREFATICVEDLSIKQMVKVVSGEGRAIQRGLSRSIHDAAWGRLVQYLTYKAERAGGRVVKVDPRRTSQTCSGCGAVAPKLLSERMHSCACGCVMDRDLNAARNVLHRGVVASDVGKLDTGRVRHGTLVCETA